MQIARTAKPTLTAVEMLHGDTLRFTMLDGRIAEIALLDTGAEILHTTLQTPGVEEPRGRTTYRFWADCAVNGRPMRLEREVGTQRSFYEPWVVDGVRIWLDAVEAIFQFMRETHSPCRLTGRGAHSGPERNQARLALQDAGARICPETVHPWCPLPAGGLRIEQCFRGEDCWLGAYDGASAHGGLDLNHPKGTPLFAPIGFDDQFLYNSLAMGHNNNRWRGIRRWPDGSQWVLQSCHMTQLTVPEHTPLAPGQHYADGAGVYTGSVEHSHFAFAVFDSGELVRLDPWILFWQMYRDQGNAPGCAPRP
jgi:hypothetical protein